MEARNCHRGHPIQSGRWRGSDDQGKSPGNGLSGTRNNTLKSTDQGVLATGRNRPRLAWRDLTASLAALFSLIGANGQLDDDTYASK